MPITKITNLSISDDSITSAKIADGGIAASDIGFSANDDFIVPVGNTSQRPSSPSAGSIRYNIDNNSLEGYNGTSWRDLGGQSNVVSFSNLQITNSSFGLIPQTALDPSGGFVKIIGSGFTSNTILYVGSYDAGNLVTSNVQSANQINASLPAKSVNLYTLIIYDNDSKKGTIVGEAVRYSALPEWSGPSSFAYAPNNSVSVQFSASSDSNVVYQVQQGSTLPPNFSLSSNGLFQGNSGEFTGSNTYSFVVEAVDTELQTTPRTFTVLFSQSDIYFNRTVLLLDGDGSNNANNNTIVDVSPTSATITRVGNTTVGTFTPFSLAEGEWSVYQSNAALDQLTFTSGANDRFQFTGDYTIEGWVYYTALGSNSTFWSTGSGGLLHQLDITTSDYSLYFNSSTPTTTISHGLSAHSWNHIAMVRDGVNVKLYTNGFLRGSFASATTHGFANPSQARVGGGAAGSTRYVSNVRAVKNQAVYQNEFTPSLTPLTATSNTTLLICQSNRIIKDNSSSNSTIVPSSGPSIVPFSPFIPSTQHNLADRGGSMFFDGASDSLNVSTIGVASGTGDFTFEWWYYPIDNSPHAGYIFNTRSSDTSDGFDCRIGIGTSGTLWCSISGSVIYDKSFINDTRPYSWNHYAFVRSSNTIQFYVNGSGKGAEPTTTNFTNTSTNIKIGISGSGTSRLKGYISDFRYVRRALYTSNNFAVPSTPLTSTANTHLHINNKNFGVVDVTGKNNINTVGNSRISTSLLKYGSGSLFFDGTGDSLIVRGIRIGSPASFDQFDFHAGDFTVEMWCRLAGTTSGYQFLIRIPHSATTNRELTIRYGDSGMGSKLQVAVRSDSSLWLHSTSATQSSHLNQWNHIAFTRASGTCRLFVNGTIQNINSGINPTTYPLTSFTDTSSVLSANNVIVGEGVNGYLDDIRITKGVARYTTDFVPPVGPLSVNST